MSTLLQKSKQISYILRQLKWRGCRRILKWHNSNFFSWDDIQVVLIVSTGRTGTQFLAELFSKILPGVESKHEPRPDLFDLATHSIRHQLSQGQILTELEGAREKICWDAHQRNKTIYVESNNNISWLLPVAVRLFNNCKIIHVVRSPQDYVRSQYSKTVRSNNKCIDYTYFMEGDDRRSRLGAADFVEDPYNESWSMMTRFEKVCWYWCKKNKIITDSLSQFDNAIRVKFEDIFSAETDYKGIWDILHFLNLHDEGLKKKAVIEEMMSRKSNESKEYLLDKWPNWPQEKKDKFQTIIGPHMKYYGY